MKSPSFYSDPHVQFLSQLIEEINQGHLQVPRFQRPMVWRWERRRELLRSIRDGIPIGAVMVWRTSGAPVECYHYLGPHKVASPPKGGTRQYLLDGVQRLSTLYGALQQSHSGVEHSNDEQFIESEVENLSIATDFAVFFDLEAKEFYIGSEKPEGRFLLPLHLVLDSVALLRFQRQLPTDAPDHVVESSDQIARAFRDCKIPLIPITTDDVDMATRTFQRINSQGARMSESHMVHALTWTPTFDLQNRMAALKSEFLQPVGWGDIDDDVILKSCKAKLGLDVYKTNAQELSDKLRQNFAVVDKVVDSIRLAADFLERRCGMSSPDLVPYALQIVVLSAAFDQCPEPDDTLDHLLYSWVWMTTYGELFAGMSGDRVQIALADMSDMLKDNRAKWSWKRPFEERPLGRAFDFRAARAKALAFRLAYAQNTDGIKAGTNILSDAGRRSLVQIIPSSKLTREWFSSPANRFLIHPAEANSLRDVVLNGTINHELASRHLIDSASLSQLQDGRYDEFVKCRAQTIKSVEADFIRPLVQPFLPSELRVQSL